jgi:Tfp pilus assembly protein PilN
MAVIAGLLESPSVRPLALFGTGVGIAVEGPDLEVCVARVRPREVRLLGRITVERFRERPASEWGREIAALLASLHASHLAAWLVLPRHEVIVRHLRLPGVSDQDAPAAIAFQLDALHPFGDEDIAHDARRIARSPSFAVAIAQRRVIDFYTALFAEAGVRLAGLTFSGSAVFVSSRLFQPPPAGGFLAARTLSEEPEPLVEIYGESPACPLFSALFDLPLERAASLAAAELRLEPDAPRLSWPDLLPAPAGAATAPPPGTAWAAALAAACPHLGAPLNLLPEHLRASSSRAQFVPTVVLAASLLLLGGALVAESVFAERQYLKDLEAEAARLAPQAQQVEKIDRELAASVQRIELLDNFRRRTRGHLDILLELTEMIEPPGMLNSLQITPDTVSLWGESEKADELLKKLEASPRFTGVEFSAPLTRGGSGDVFRIRARREGAAP